MKMNPEFELSVLEKYGFNKIDKEESRINGDYATAKYEYEYSLGHSRRGQFYSILVHENGRVSIYASKPDGDGAEIEVDDVLVELINDSIIISD